MRNNSSETNTGLIGFGPWPRKCNWSISNTTVLLEAVLLNGGRGDYILVAENHDANFVIVGRHLANHGYRVMRALPGDTAAELAAVNRFDLVLMDMEMPEINGLVAARLIRQNELRSGGLKKPILAMTAKAEVGCRERCLDAGCTGFVPKPIRKHELMSAVSRTLFESRVRAL